MRTCSRLVVVAAFVAAVAVFAEPIRDVAPAAWRRAAPDHAWSFPRDHWAHPDYRIEWWYLTGHLQTVSRPRRRFGYQVTIFRIGLAPRPLGFDSAWSGSNLLMGHAAISDKESGRHVFSELLYRETELLAGFGAYPDAEIAWSRAPIGGPGRWSLRWNGEAFDVSLRDDTRGIALELETRPSKPLVLQGPNGFSRKSDEPGAASLYYSFTRLDTRGSLQLDERRHEVAGQSWMDQEFSTSQLGERQVGWDWFGLQLDDGRELMLYLLRAADGRANFARGTLVSRDGRPRYLAAQDWSVRATGRWRSPASGSTYPAGWIVELPGEPLRLELVPDVANQENVGRLAGGLRYWEGAVTVRDAAQRVVGQGYVELTGYGEGNRPPI